MCRKLSFRCIVSAAICPSALCLRTCNTSCAERQRWTSLPGKVRGVDGEKRTKHPGLGLTLKLETVLSRNKVILCHARQVSGPQSAWLQRLKWSDSEWMTKLIPVHVGPLFSHQQSHTTTEQNASLKCKWRRDYRKKSCGLFQRQLHELYLVFIKRQGPLNGGLHENQYGEEMWGGE